MRRRLDPRAARDATSWPGRRALASAPAARDEAALDAAHGAAPPDGVAEVSTDADDWAHRAARAQRQAARRAERVVGRRRRRGGAFTVLTAVAAGAALVPLVTILGFLLVRGAAALTPALVLRSPVPGGDGGGLANGIVGSLLILAIACALGVPVGLGAGLFLAERRGTRVAGLLRYLTDVLLGVPSIVFGIVAWQLLVRPVGHFSAWAGGVALAAMLVPLVARATDELVALVPPSLTEAALALGYPRWRTTLQVTLRAAAPGIVTGAFVAVARIAGETAPLVFTAFGNQYWNLRPDRPIAALPLQLYVAASGASEVARRQAYAGALLLVAAVAAFGWAARRATRRARPGAESER